MNTVRLPSRIPLAVVILGWIAILGSTGSAFVFDRKLEGAGRSDLIQELWSPGSVAFVTAILSAAVVGSVLVIRRARHPVGWIFVALAISVSSSAVLDGYTAYGAVARPGSLPAAGLVANLADIVFIPWLTMLAFVLLLTPSGQFESRVAKLAGLAAGLGGLVAFGAAVFREYQGDHAGIGTIENPLAMEGLAGELNFLVLAGLVVLHAGLLMAAGLLFLRFRRSNDSARSQLRWLALAAIPFPFLVVGAWIAAAADNDVILGLAAGGFLAIVSIGAGLAIERDRLYDVDRLLSRGLSYSLLTAALIGCYVTVVLAVGRALGDRGGESQVPAVVATLLTVSIAMPTRRRLQDALDRRFNRRRFEAVTAIRRFVQQPDPDTTIEQALRDALGDPHLAVAYWVSERERWFDERGNPATPSAQAITVERRNSPVAAVEYDGRINRKTVAAAATEALPELENARLRTAIVLQLVEVRDSRARIVAAQVAERRKLERNLHDGAQQRLLAIALDLRAAEVGDDARRMRAAIDDAVQQLQTAVGELRAVANGLHPTVLTDGGLAAALDDLAARTPVAVRLNATADRLAAPVEEAAWYIACEAVTNAVKHARPQLIDITACARDGRLRVVVEDDGVGGADPHGNGLRGIADRAEAAGGWLKVRERPAGGTIVTAELPCAW